MPRLVLRPELKREAEEAALEAAFQANDERDIGYHAEGLITAAVQAVLDLLAERLV